MPSRLPTDFVASYLAPLAARLQRYEPSALLWLLVKWTLLGAWVGLLSGCASAFFLWSLALVTSLREQHPASLWLLPLGGMGVGLLYHRFGKSVEAGNNLLLERIHDPKEVIPFRMAPLVLMGTLATHLFGGSAGREGTAVQMGGALADLISTPLRRSAHDRRLLLMAGISGGFGSVFGTPLAGAVFGMEALTVGRVSYEGLLPCFIASVTGDLVCRAWHIHHSLYPLIALPKLTLLGWVWIVLLGALSGGTARAFSEATHTVARFARRIPTPWLRPLAGGIVIIALTYAVGTRDYLGLSLPLIARSFTPQGVAGWAFALKIVFTAVTLGTGFKGGEVTPLFCIGATLGAAMAQLVGQPPTLFAALGFVAVFAGAANTPLACVLMGMELFGGAIGVPLFAVCLLSYALSGHKGIYSAQRVGVPKSPYGRSQE